MFGGFLVSLKDLSPSAHHHQHHNPTNKQAMHTSETGEPCSNSGDDGTPSQLFSLDMMRSVAAASSLTCGNASSVGPFILPGCSGSPPRSVFFSEYHLRAAAPLRDGANRAPPLLPPPTKGLLTGNAFRAVNRFTRGGISGLFCRLCCRFLSLVSRKMPYFRPWRNREIRIAGHVWLLNAD